jgi:hypothetical protein
MTINTTAANAKLAQALALVNADRVQDLQSSHARYAAQVERLLSLQAGAPLSREQDLELANARRMAKQTRSQIEQTEKDNTAHRAEADRLQALIDSPAMLKVAVGHWEQASAAQVKATARLMKAGEDLDKVRALLSAQEQEHKKADAAYAAEALAVLGFGESAARNSKPYDFGASDRRMQALRDLITKMEAEKADAESALIEADRATRVTESAIVKAKADRAELIHIGALEAYRAALVELHGARLAATGAEGPRVVPYQEGDRELFAAVAERIKDEAEQGL